MYIDFKVILLAFAVSIDGFGVGLACGLKRLVILPISLIIICFSSSGAVALSMFTGQTLVRYIPAELAARGGGFLLMLLGLYFIIQSISALYKKNNNLEEELKLKKVNKKRFTTGITRAPEKADTDKSGTLSARESLVLAIALGADAFGAGFGAVLAGLNPIVTVFAVGIVKLVLVPLGVLIGRMIVSVGSFADYAPIISGLLLMIIGISVFV